MHKIRSYIFSLSILSFVLITPAHSETNTEDENQAEIYLSFPTLTEPLGFKKGDRNLTEPLGYKKGDWKRPIGWNERSANKAKYGDGVTIGIMDTPINCNHENLKTTSKRKCESYYFGTGSFTKKDFEHGSNAAGVAAGTGGYGLARNANIVGFAVFDDNGWYMTDNQYYSAVNYLVNTKNAKVLNWSYGIGFQPGMPFMPMDSVDMTAARIANGKALIVKSAGNGYRGVGQFYDGVSYGGADKDVLKKFINNVIFVGALNPKGNKIAGFSDRPGESCIKGYLETKCTNKNKYKYYFIVAPGYVNTTAGSGNGSSNTQGTSFSAPIVAGAAALIKSRWPHLKPDQIRDILLKTTKDMGRKGVDKIYGRGALNVKKALKPIKGKVGGVKINSKNSAVFRRSASLGGFSHDVTVTDIYGRNFDAVTHVVNNNATLDTVEILPEGNMSIHLIQNSIIDDDVSFTFNGVSVNGFSYFSEITGEPNYLSFDANEGPLSELAPSLLELNIGNQAAVYEKNNYTLFAMVPKLKIGMSSDVQTFGVKKSWKSSDSLTLTSTVALVSEKGFHGLSSQKGFGFENENDAVFLDLGLSHFGEFASFDFGLNHHKTFASYSSKNISWSALGVTQLRVGFSKAFGNSRIGVKATTDLDPTGKVKSSIKGLTTVDNFYNKRTKVGLNFDKNISDNSSVVFNLSTEGRVAADLFYNVWF